VLLLDEATSALDAETTQAAEQLIHTWQTENTDARTAIWVSHDAAQTDRVAPRKLKIEAGRLQESAL
jgi:ABC-type iron transport system FetAB ATPase subunit